MPDDKHSKFSVQNSDPRVMQLGEKIHKLISTEMPEPNQESLTIALASLAIVMGVFTGMATGNPEAMDANLQQTLGMAKAVAIKIAADIADETTEEDPSVH